ncbi:PAB-dependent poly(A)-specific ribonuclease subunit 3 [Coemansia sp. RSA 1358]|nr:hypothetical protein BX070DRAFT_222572 [Coemansia spiralis]KAJ1995715.1 PAB-dependent poly(A)-specific ribonuclease subunit 3 [Coemansia umbellata]KAJ2623681.1 PAB-dependent poly(A)-specific ribonuclease subunit 3 [Coemansia sp. RSA 1358]
MSNDNGFTEKQKPFSSGTKLAAASELGKISQSPVTRAQSSGKLRASSPAFQPSPAKNQQPGVVAGTGHGSATSSIGGKGSSRLRLVPEFTPKSKQQKRVNEAGRDGDISQLRSKLAESKLTEPTITQNTAEPSVVGDGNIASNDDFFMKVPDPSNQKPYMKPISYFAIDENLRRALAEEMRTMNHVIESDLPFQIHNYHSLSPLENEMLDFDISNQISQQEIKAQSIADGCHYSLHRIPNIDPANKPNLSAIDKWKMVQAPNIAQVHEAFTTRAFGDNSLVLVCDYKPLTSSLKNKILDSRMPVTEAFLWSIVLQLVSALRIIHFSGLSVQTLGMSTVLMSPAGRVYINSCGLADVLGLYTGYNLEAMQQNDLHAIGKILASILAMNRDNVVLMQSQASVVMPGSNFSTDFKELFGYLNRRLTPVIALDDILRLAGPRIFFELDHARREADLLHSNLKLEMANGRLVRLLCKINFITERADSAMDPEWSETGDRYLIKLFRDYVFHLIGEDGKPSMDMAHVVGNLNKLDAGSQEKVMLMSRDEKSCLVVSYQELKRCIESAYTELMAISPRPWK